MAFQGKLPCQPVVQSIEVEGSKLFLETAGKYVHNMKELSGQLGNHCRLLLLLKAIIRPMTSLKLDMICDRVAGACFAKTG